MDNSEVNKESAKRKTRARDVKGKRISKKPRVETIPTPSVKTEPRTALWTEEYLVRLIDHMKKNGFDGDYSTIQKMFPNFSENTIKGFFNQLSRWHEPIKDDSNTNSQPGEVTQAPVEQWISMIRESIEVQRLGCNPALIFEWISLFEEHPDPASCCGVDYKAIYSYISALLEGHIPKQLDPPSASKLYMMFQQLVNTISQSAKSSQNLLLKTVKKTQVGYKCDRNEKNRILRERRRAAWTEEELEQARIVQSDDLERIKKVYCDKPGLNPFCFPPSI